MKRLVFVALMLLSGSAFAAAVEYLNVATPAMCPAAFPREEVRVRMDNQCGDQISVQVIYRRQIGLPDIVHNLVIPMGVSIDHAAVFLQQDLVRVIVRADSGYWNCLSAVLAHDICTP